MGMVLFQFQQSGSKPTLNTLYRRFGFRAGEVDREYGVVLVDSEADMYVALVDEEAQGRVEPRLPDDAAERGIGFFSNPRIEPFGPPEG
jgi:hypothetical protein